MPVTNIILFFHTTRKPLSLQRAKEKRKKSEKRYGQRYRTAKKETRGGGRPKRNDRGGQHRSNASVGEVGRSTESGMSFPNRAAHRREGSASPATTAGLRTRCVGWAIVRVRGSSLSLSLTQRPLHGQIVRDISDVRWWGSHS